MKSALKIGHVFQTIIFVLFTGVLFFCQSTEKSKNISSIKNDVKNDSVITVTAPSEKNSTTQQQQDSRQLVVYYLHGTFRCPSCNTIERLTKQAVEQGFAEQLATGRVQLKILNIEEPGNEHFAEDYKLYTKSVILSDRKNGKEIQWKNLEKIWTLLHDETKFIEYINSEVKSYL
jgi:RNase H-fold protein (predicted Holliday junction resolvase)